MKSRLGIAAFRISKASGEDAALRADACIVLSVLSNLKRDVARGLKWVDLAEQLRPKHARQLEWRAGIHATRGSFSNALQDLLKAREVTTREGGPHAALECHLLTDLIGKSLLQLDRSKEARRELEAFVLSAWSDEVAPLLTERNRGHAIVSQYMLVELCDRGGDRGAARRHWEQAERREAQLDPTARRAINFDAKMLAQMTMASAGSDAPVSGRECVNCHRPAEQPVPCEHCVLRRGLPH